MSIAQGLLPFKIEFVSRAETVTAHAGLFLAIEAALALFPAKALRPLRKALGYQTVTPVRRHLLSLIALACAGGDHVSGLETLRADQGCSRLLGFEPSSPSQAKDFLYRFHQDEDGRPLTDEDDERLSVRGKAQIRPEGPGLRALTALMDLSVEAVRQRRLPTKATIDVDARIIEAHKQKALVAYEGTRGYQPQMAWWSELGVWLTDQFRDGNVNAELEAKAFLKLTFERLPSSIEDRYLRADSALYNENALSWADEQEIGFAVSADMSEALKSKVTRLPEEAWLPYRGFNERADLTEERQWAEVPDFVPDWKRNRKKDGTPFRYIAIRVRGRQKDLFEDSDPSAWRYFAIVTNMGWNGERLLRWHREKQGTVEYGHGVVKNDLAGGVMPCGRFGSNAAWSRLQLIVHNLLVLLKTEALPSTLRDARPKTLRFLLFNLPGRIVRHARGWVLKLYEGLPFAADIVAARRHLLELARRLRAPRRQEAPA